MIKVLIDIKGDCVVGIGTNQDIDDIGFVIVDHDEGELVSEILSPDWTSVDMGEMYTDYLNIMEKLQEYKW